MVLTLLNADDTSTTFTAATPPESVVQEKHSEGIDLTMSNSKPVPGYIYMIRCVATGEAITLSFGTITLAPVQPSHRASVAWVCERSPDDSLGFRNAVSGKYLGRNNTNEKSLQCTVDWHKGWEKFWIGRKLERGFELLMDDGGKKTLAVKEECIVRKAAVIPNCSAEMKAWEFIKL